MAPPALLVVHPGALGDLVCIFPLLVDLRRRFDSIGILCQGPLGRLAAAEGLVDTGLALEAAWTATLFSGDPGPEARSRLSAFTHALAFSGSMALAASLQRVFDGRLCRCPPRPPAEAPIHVTDHARRHLIAGGLLGAPEAEAPSAGGAGRGVDRRGATLALLHPGAGSPRKRWPLRRFVEVARRLRSRRLHPEFIIGPAEEDLAEALIPLGEAAFRPADLLQLAARLREAAVYIGNDSGVSHLAAWTGTPTIAVFGPTDPARWRPRGPRVEVLRPPLDCRPCFEMAADNCGSPACLKRISPPAVLKAAERLMAEAAPAANA